MTNDNHIKTFTAADIERYHKGQLSPKERHALEKAALDDPFLADALEGYAVAGVHVSADIAELKKRLAAKTEETKVIPITGGNSSYRWLRAAAVILFIAGAGLFSYQFLFNKKTNEIVQLNKKENETVKTTEPVTIQPQVNDADTLSVPGSITTTLSSPGYKKEAENPSARQNTETKQTTGNAGAEPLPAKGDIVTTTINKEVPVTTAPVKAEEKVTDEVVKSLRNDNAADKNSFTLTDDKKSKEAVSKKKADADADGVPDTPLNEEIVAAKGAASNNRARQDQSFQNNMNYFRGRITDANNNPLPFTNVTNTSDNVGTYSDAKGNFTLVSTDSVMDVQLRSLGFENSRIRLRSDLPTNQVMLQEDRSIPARVLDTVKRNYAAVQRNGNLTFEEPEPADGWSSYGAYLANNLNMPDNFESKKGYNTDANSVELSFEVNKNGDPVNIKIEKSLCDKCDKEAIRLIKTGPKWKRKAKKGKRTTVKVPFVKMD